jgi:hypothetical protein
VGLSRRTRTPLGRTNPWNARRRDRFELNLATAFAKLGSVARESPRRSSIVNYGVA